MFIIVICYKMYKLVFQLIILEIRSRIIMIKDFS